ncbi:uncharacterized protein EI97DRAFT_434325 [Westerdykella ornata]|uniref:Uncharacterized protein n=1 Tax=Westerdykella ornata TaxID=318751 RepID=A0A6A6JGV1_WESOR|nr:uncharacterized protein EI97DRAFT_434325 [Westerdykella ornata]KAF2275485.1 hypothetical protein EI97DRAFT_434325 [Westerdykella ornata]
MREPLDEVENSPQQDAPTNYIKAALAIQGPPDRHRATFPFPTRQIRQRPTAKSALEPHVRVNTTFGEECVRVMRELAVAMVLVFLTVVVAMAMVGVLWRFYVMYIFWV